MRAETVKAQRGNDAIRSLLCLSPEQWPRRGLQSKMVKVSTPPLDPLRAPQHSVVTHSEDSPGGRIFLATVTDNCCVNEVRCRLRAAVCSDGSTVDNTTLSVT